MRQPSLFEELPDPPPAPLVRIRAKQARLSPKQKRFNQLTRRIESLQRRILERRQELDRLLREYRQRILPLEDLQAEKARSLAFALDQEAARRSCGKRMREDLRHCILSLLEISLAHREEDPEAEGLYAHWSGPGSDGEEAELAAAVSDYFKSTLGVDLDPELLRRDPEAAAEQVAAQMQAGEGSFAPPPRPRKARPKSAKQIEQEERARAAEAMAQRTVRSVYIGLARILHPDVETDPELRAEKEQLMKQLTEAKDNNDLYTLLKLEMTWLQREEGHLEGLPEATLDQYLGYLKEQVAGLEEELGAIPYEPAYAELGLATSAITLEWLQRDLRDNCQLLEEAAAGMRTFNAAYLRELVQVLD